MTPCKNWPHVRKADGRAIMPGFHGAYAYRVKWEEAYGPIPLGMVIDHECGNKACVNVSHMNLVTQSEHLKMEITRGIITCGDANVGQARKTHCPKGHPYSGDNLYMASRGDRQCRECRREARRRCDAKKRGL